MRKLAFVPRKTAALVALILTVCCPALPPPAAFADGPAEVDAAAVDRLFRRDNLIAWCIVPFDSRKRGPEERAAMLEKLGFTHFAYDWRPEHVPTFDAEVDALKKHKVALDAWWVGPGVLNDDSKRILDVLRRHSVKAQLWVLLDLGPDKVTGPEQERRVESAANSLRPLAEAAEKVGCTIALYNHGGWFGEPENQLAVIERLESRGVKNLGMVYNLHHGHDHIDRFPELLRRMKPRLLALNLNGMDPKGDKIGRKILPLGQGSLDLGLLRTIVASGYQGPIGILGHTEDDAEQRLRDNLDGLDWLVPQLKGKAPGARPTPRTPVPPAPAGTTNVTPDYNPALALTILAEARASGDSRKGAEIFASPRFGCVTCHKVGGLGGGVGPELTTAGLCQKPELLVEAILWPQREVKEGYRVRAVATHEGKIIRGYPLEDAKDAVFLRDPSSGDRVKIAKADVEEVRDEGSLMPEALATSMTPAERRDLVCFLLDLGRPGGNAADALKMADNAPATFTFDKGPLKPELWPAREHPVNRSRLYDFYPKEAAAFLNRPGEHLLPQFPGIDGGREGHWGNQNEKVWADERWGKSDHGNVLAGVFRGAGVTVPKGVSVRLGENGEVSACFNPETLCYEAAWTGGFVTMSGTRHGFMDGTVLDGTPLPRPAGTKPAGAIQYHGYYRSNKRVVFSYAVDGVEMLDAPWAENGAFTRVVAAADRHPLAALTKGGAPLWPEVVTTKGSVGSGTGPYVVDTIAPPFKNPWGALMFFGDHDFLPDGSAMLATMTGDVWHVEGLDDRLQNVRWRRFASGLHQALGLVVADGKVYVLGRDQITRLEDRNGDGEADFYECVSNAYKTSTSGHDFICGLQRDASGRFYTASGPQGVLRISADGKTVEPLATGFRNPDGLGLNAEGVVTVPCSEGEWTPTSMICEITPGSSYGYGGPRNGQRPDLPLVYLPRGLDNSSGGQVFVEDDRFGPLKGQLLHFSFGMGTWFLVLRDKVDGLPQGAVVPMPGEFRSGSHRGRFNPKDGQLYVSGMAGWGSYTVDDGSFQRVRYTGVRAQVPLSLHAHQNGVVVTFAEPVNRATAEKASSQFAQAWNYRYSQAYGSSEWSTRHPGVTGHDRLEVRSAHVLDDGRSLFLEIPEIQPVNQLHLELKVGADARVDIYATVHRLAPPFTGFAGYQAVAKTIAAHPILADMVEIATPPPRNPWLGHLAGERSLTIEAGKNLSFSTRTLRARAGEPLRLTFSNPDAVPHNWALIKPGSLARFGDLVNKIVADPEAARRQYVPKSDDVLAYTDIVRPQEEFTIAFNAPTTPGRYPFLCTFPGHWMVMNGELIVE